MSAFLISLFFTAGAATWIYTKMQKQTGNDTERSLLAAAAAGAVIFLIFYTALGLIL